MEIINSEDTEEIGLVLSKEEAEALGYALSRFTCHEPDNVLSQLVYAYLTKMDIDYKCKALNTKHRRAARIDGLTEITVFSLVSV